MSVTVRTNSVVANHGTLIEFEGTTVFDADPDTIHTVRFFADTVAAASIAWRLDRGEEVITEVPTFMLGAVT